MNGRVSLPQSCTDVVRTLVDCFSKIKHLTMYSCWYSLLQKTLSAVLPSLPNLAYLDVSLTDNLLLSETIAELKACGLLNKLSFLGFATNREDSSLYWNAAKAVSL